MRRLLAAAALCQLATPTQANAPRLHAAIVVTRHGDRSALHEVPAALTPALGKVDRQRWLGAPFGDLTSVGEEQHRRLGARCRCRYGQLIGPRYDTSKIWARSTASDRALRSGQAFLHGLYGDADCDSHPFRWRSATATEGGLAGTGGGDEVLAPSLVSSLWGGDAGRTAALHSVPKEQDTLLRAFDNCPRYTQLLEEVHASHEWLAREEIELQPGGTLATWRKTADAAAVLHDVAQTWSLWCFVPLFDSINVLLRHGFASALPAALTAKDAQPLRKAAELYHWCRARKYGPAPELGRISGGLFARAIRHRLVALAHAHE